MIHRATATGSTPWVLHSYNTHLCSTASDLKASTLGTNGHALKCAVMPLTKHQLRHCVGRYSTQLWHISVNKLATTASVTTQTHPLQDRHHKLCGKLCQQHCTGSQHLPLRRCTMSQHMGVFVTREHVRHNKSGITHRGKTRISH
jgi:hypothetical protein